MRTKLNYSIIVIIMFGFLSCTQKNNLELNISGIGNDTIYVENYLLSNIEEDPILDTIYSENGKVSYDLPIKETLITVVTPKKSEYYRLDKSPFRPFEKSILLVLNPNDKISINGKLDDLQLNYEVKGSNINEMYIKNRNKYLNSLIDKSKIELEIDSLRFHNASRDRINSLSKKRNNYRAEVRSFQLDYIKNNLDEELSAYYLTRQPLDTLGKYFEYLDSSVKESAFKNLLNDRFIMFKKYTRIKEAESKIVIGKKAPQFALKSIDGEIYTVDFSKKDYTVLDFWGSWCTPCISGFPKMKEKYEQFKDKIEIIGIACNDTENKWKKTINKHDLKWKNLINNEKLDKDVSVKYAVEGFPTKLIINSNGIIVGIFKGEGKDFYEKLNDLIKL
ncbi:TlpA family protein disulfide reductase [Aureivirga sp. CE67]|uniref:TlpA family protein disulfide reductase n=1 Tax=Aureivirga sp. CE67 TaxID=1788983 RepID=UPI0018C9E58F|nr:thioredoxin-like domain-containing protein [Aureivirga sp. CE67]